LIVNGELPWEGYMLIVSLGAMAIQGLIYLPYYKIMLKHLTVASVFLLHNEIIDYIYSMMTIYSSLSAYYNEMGYFTFWLSLYTLILIYQILKKFNTDKL